MFVLNVLKIFGHLLEPLVTLDNIQQQPVTMLYELCQKLGKKLDFTYSKNGAESVTNVYVDGKLLSTASSEQKETSKLAAAKDALQIMMIPLPSRIESNANVQIAAEVSEIREAKHKLIEYCSKNGFLKPTYRYGIPIYCILFCSMNDTRTCGIPLCVCVWAHARG